MQRRWVVAFCVLTACGGRALFDGAGGAGSSASTGSANSSSSATTATSATSATSSGSGQSFTACNGPGQCTLSHRGCCEGCGATELEDVVAVARDQVENFRSSECPVPEPCDSCEPCENGNLYAYCDNGTCRAADLRKEPYSECSSADDCILRAGTDCCQGCGLIDLSCGGLVAINADKEQAFTQLVCSAAGEDCPGCAPQFPDGAAASCITGRCVYSSSRP